MAGEGGLCEVGHAGKAGWGGAPRWCFMLWWIKVGMRDDRGSESAEASTRRWETRDKGVIFGAGEARRAVGRGGFFVLAMKMGGLLR